MNLIKENQVPAQPRKLSLDVFKDKMIQEVHHEKGGSSAMCGTVAAGGFVTAWLVGKLVLDTCHDD